ncbi:hypothetical protein R6Q57_021262 [Mikania cordata]
MTQNRGGKYKFEGLHPLKKFSQFGEMEDVDVVEAAEIPNVFVEEGHDIEIVSSKPSDEDVYVVKLPKYEDVVIGYEPYMDFDFEMETILIESDPPEQVNLLTNENLEALLEHVIRSVGNPPSAPSFADQEPPLDVAADLIQTITIEPTESSPKVKESTAGSSSHTKDIDYDSFPAGETGIRVDKGKNVLPKDEPIYIVKLQSRVFELQQDSLSHTLLIQELNIDNELKDKKIKDLETNKGNLSAIVLDLKKKLQDKFKGEFVDESSPSTTAEPAPKMSKTDFDELTRSREEGLRKYCNYCNTGFKVSIAKSRELMMTTDRTIQEAKDEAKFKPTGFIIDVGDSRYNYEGDRSGIFCWGYDEVKDLWWIHRKLTKRIQYYDHPSSFKSLTLVDMVELARQRFFNPSKNKRGESFYTSLQQHVKKGFSDMTLSQSIKTKKKKNPLGNPIDIDIFEVRWSAVDWMKKMPILLDLPEGILDDFKLWAFL